MFDVLNLFSIFFEGIPFNLKYFESSSLKLLIDTFGLSSLAEFISTTIPDPVSLSDAISFLSNYQKTKFLRQTEKSFSILISEFSSLKIEDLRLFTNDQLFHIFSSQDLTLDSEDYLFSLVIELSKKDYSKTALLQTVFLPFVSSSSLKTFFDEFTVDELDSNFFENIKERLCSDLSFPVSTHKYRVPQIFLTRSEIDELDAILYKYFNKHGPILDRTKELIQISNVNEATISQFIQDSKELQRQNALLDDEKEANKQKFQKEIYTQEGKNRELFLKIYPPHRPLQHVPLDQNNGIFKYLRDQDECFVTVVKSNVLDDHVQNKPENLFIDDDTYFASKNEPNSYLIFHFPYHKVRFFSYIIRALGYYSYKGWKVEGSQDNYNWILLDQRSSENFTVDENVRQHEFQCQNQDEEYYSFLQLTQTEKNNRDHDYFVFSFLEFSGELYQTKDVKKD